MGSESYGCPFVYLILRLVSSAPGIHGNPEFLLLFVQPYPGTVRDLRCKCELTTSYGCRSFINHIRMGDPLVEFKDVNIQLTELGAIIINSDGTMSKIENWNELTDLEKARSLRLIAKRNAKRKAQLEQMENQPKDRSEMEESQETLAIEN